ncbi:MAG: SCP2 sterol-binding domain-containing protein [Candidatus Helarchaeota archaeon]
MRYLNQKLIEFCENFNIKFHEKGTIKDEYTFNYINDGFKFNLIVSNKKNQAYTILFQKNKCKFAKGFSSSQLNLTTDLKTWKNIFDGKDRIIKGIMEGRIKLRGIRPTLSRLIKLSSIIYICSIGNDLNEK